MHCSLPAFIFNSLIRFIRHLGLILFALNFSPFATYAQKKYSPTIEICDCRFKMDSSYAAIAPASIKSNLSLPINIDSSFQTQCGYLIVPENRKNSKSKMIKLPFIVLKSKNPKKKKDPVLFTSGGPGNSSLGWINGMQKSLVIGDRDCIAFEQRGTRYAIPYLRLFEIDSAMKEAYRKNLSKDSMWLEAVKRYKKRLLQKGIDLDGYNSDETVSDITDLLSVLKIDSVNLFGGSYSGGLMMAVLQKNPNKVRSLVLDSPLPMFVPIDEDEPVNFHEGLHVLFEHVEKDSADKGKYADLMQRFYNYFTSIRNTVFSLPYYDSTEGKTLNIQYTKNELLDIVVSDMLNYTALKDLPFKITELLRGNHAPYLKPRIDRILNGYPAPDGMRMSVYCADQAAFHNQERVKQIYKLYPYMEGYHINDVWQKVCDCWNVQPIKEKTKQPFYSPVPALIGDGEMDPACRPLYMRLIRHYMPNAQTFLFINRSHGVGGKDFFSMTQQFLDNPYKKIKPPSETVVPY